MFVSCCYLFFFHAHTFTCLLGRGSISSRLMTSLKLMSPVIVSRLLRHLGGHGRCAGEMRFQNGALRLYWPIRRELWQSRVIAGDPLAAGRPTSLDRAGAARYRFPCSTRLVFLSQSVDCRRRGLVTAGPTGAHGEARAAVSHPHYLASLGRLGVFVAPGPAAPADLPSAAFNKPQESNWAGRLTQRQLCYRARGSFVCGLACRDKSRSIGRQCSLRNPAAGGARGEITIDSADSIHFRPGRAHWPLSAARERRSSRRG